MPLDNKKVIQVRAHVGYEGLNNISVTVGQRLCPPLVLGDDVLDPQRHIFGSTLIAAPAPLLQHSNLLPPAEPLPVEF
jgi:hypothetical protein